MATLLDHARRTQTRGTPDNLTPFMESAVLRVIYDQPGHYGNPRRVAASSVRAAIRRGGRTDAGQELVMSDTERAAWDAANPIPEW